MVLIYRRKCVGLRVLGQRQRLLLIILSTWSSVALLAFWSVSHLVTWPWIPLPHNQDLSHFRRNRSLAHYLEHIQLLVQPSSPCQGDVPLLAIVPSAASRGYERQVIRDTWGQHQPTYFLLGLDVEDPEYFMIETYIEAKLNSDIIIYDVRDHYQNLTLKTCLMLHWVGQNCAHAHMVFKVDDDVLVNPWILGEVLEDRKGADLLGFKFNNSNVNREEYSKWYLPRWMLSEDMVPAYLAGSAYLIKGSIIPRLLEAALQTPLINIEDIYLTYLVANKKLNLNLTHDYRLSNCQPDHWLFKFVDAWYTCMNWTLACSHSLKPEKILYVWSKIFLLGKDYERGENVCEFYKKYIKRYVYIC